MKEELKQQFETDLMVIHTLTGTIYSITAYNERLIEIWASGMQDDMFELTYIDEDTYALEYLYELDEQVTLIIRNLMPRQFLDNMYPEWRKKADLDGKEE